MELVTLTDNGFYCEQADVYIDPWRPVKKALITHAHADHARPNHQYYLSHQNSEEVLRLRLGQDITLQTLAYHAPITINGVEIELFPAGHIPGSAQVALTYKGKRTVITGDFKLEDDGISTPFEPVPCHTLIMESTFGLPIYEWPNASHTLDQLVHWAKENSTKGLNTVIFAYALGKAQRVMSAFSNWDSPIYLHGAIWNVTEALKNQGYAFPPYERITKDTKKSDLQGALVIAPPSALGTPWMQRLKPYRTAITSGWMALRGVRRRRAADRGFVLSDHADWKGLNAAVEASSPEKVLVTHGYTEIYARWLRERGWDAHAAETFFGDDSTEDLI